MWEKTRGLHGIYGYSCVCKTKGNIISSAKHLDERAVLCAVRTKEGIYIIRQNGLIHSCDLNLLSKAKIG